MVLMWTLCFVIYYVLYHVYAWIDEGCINIHLGDLKVIVGYVLWNVTLFTHCAKYYLRVTLGKGVKLKMEDNVFEILNVINGFMGFCEWYPCITLCMWTILWFIVSNSDEVL